MKITRILDHAEVLDHHQRWQYMIGLGKESKKNKRLAEVLLELASSELHYERLLALMSASGSFDKDIIIKILLHPSLVGMSTATYLAASHLEINQLIEIVPQLSKQKRMKMVLALQKEKRYDVIELIHPKLEASEQQDLLPYTSESFLKAHFTEEEVCCFSETQWSRIACYFPQITYEYIKKIIRDMNASSWLIQRTVHTVIWQFYRTNPDLGMSLITMAIHQIPHTNLMLDQYSCLYPEQIAAIVLSYPTHLTLKMSAPALRKLDVQVLSELVEKRHIMNLQAVFAKLRPEQRAMLYTQNREAFRDVNGALPITYLKAMAQAEREKEARHAFLLQRLETRPQERIPYLAMLPFTKAQSLAEPFLNQPEGELRAAAVAALVQCGRYDEWALAPILDFALKREHEQDPVRLAMITALASLAPTHWSEAHLPKIKQIIDAALRSRDCSFQTLDASARLLFKMISCQTDFVVKELPILVERMGRLNVTNLESQLSNEDVLRIEACLLPLLKTWIARDRSHLAVALLSSFGCRIKSTYQQQKERGKKLKFIQLMVDLTKDKRGHIARIGLDSLIQWQIHTEVAQLIPQLIKRDESWIQVTGVCNYLHIHRQSLLTPFLTPRKYTGRFKSGAVLTIPNFETGFFRWTAEQQNRYGNSLSGILKSDRRNAWELYRCVSRFSVMPSVDLSTLFELADSNTKDLALRDKALEALGRVDAGRGVDFLVQALADDRARVAIYAIRRSVMAMSSQNALSLLSKTPRNKVTVAKEILRLAGEFEGEDAYAFLITFTNEEDLHQDIKIALLRAFWKYLNREAVWDYFHIAAQDKSAALARSTIRIPQEGLTAMGREHLCQQMIWLLQHENAQVRLETLERLVAMPLGQADNAMFEILAQMLEAADSRVCRLAAEALLVSYVQQDVSKLVATFAAVKSPRSIRAVVDAFKQISLVYQAELKACAEALSLALVKTHQHPSAVLQLTIVMLSPAAIFDIIKIMLHSDVLHPGAVEANTKTWSIPVKTFPQQELTALEASLRNSENVALRRLGLALLTELSKLYGWLAEYQNYLQEYCADQDFWVSEAAGVLELPQTLEE